MLSPFIRLGDKTSHGGTVITADVTFLIYDKPAARVGDLTVCPKCKGVFPIATGAEDMFGMGQQVARHGDRTACGASLIASQATALWGDESSLAKAEAAPGDSLTAASKAIASEAPTICLECLAQAAAAGTAMVVRG